MRALIDEAMPLHTGVEPAGGGARAETGIVTGTASTVLNAVIESHVGMAVWRRSMPEAVRTWADRVAAETAIKAGLLIPAEDCEDRIEKALRRARITPSPAEEQVRGDIAALTRLFADIGGLRSVDVRLETVKGDACWKFHVDQVAFRLICTYSGPGTQYVPPECGRQAIAQQRDYTGPVAMLEAYDVAVFKGAQASGHDGIVHRSPPILGSGHVGKDAGEVDDELGQERPHHRFVRIRHRAILLIDTPQERPRVR